MKHLLTQFGLSVGLASYATVGSPSADRRRQQLKHITFMLLFLLAGVGQVWGEEASLTSISTKDVTPQGNDDKGATVSKEFNGVTCLITKNSANQPGFYTSQGIVRYYSSDVMTLSVESGNVITKIEFVMNSGSVGTASPTGLSDNMWTGSSESVSFTGGGTVKITSITVTYSTSGSGNTTD